MPLKPYAEYEAAADAAAKQKHKRWTLPSIGICAVIGAVIGAAVYTDSRVVGGAIGAAIGAMLGALLKWGISKSLAANMAADNYTKDWCAENGCRSLGDGISPPNGPYADDGFKREASDAIEGQFGAYTVMFYNFSYWTKSSDSDGSSTETEHPYKIMQLTGKTIPIERLTMKDRGFMSVQWFDKIEGAVTKERPVKLESVEFNKKFDLTIDDHADDIWIRRIFDPATIQDCVTGKIVIPNLQYYDQAWWLVDDKHFKAKELDTLKTWQARAAVAIDHLSRVQNL